MQYYNYLSLDFHLLNLKSKCASLDPGCSWELEVANWISTESSDDKKSKTKSKVKLTDDSAGVKDNCFL